MPSQEGHLTPCGGCVCSFLSTYLPYPVRHKDGKAKWVRDKSRLEVTLPIVRADW